MPINRIHKTKDGRYTYSITDDRGNRHRLASRIGETRKAFAERCDDLDESVSTVAGSEGMRFDDLFRLWDKDHLAGKSKGHRRSITKLYDLRVRPTFGHRKLHDITPQHCYDFLMSQVREGLSKSYIAKIRNCLSGPFKHAIRSGLYSSNPTSGIRLSYTDDNRRESPNRALTSNEIHRFTDSAQGSKYQDYFVLLLETGLRPSEALALTIDDIGHDTVTVSGGITRHDQSRGKTENAQRTIPIRPDLADVLKARAVGTEWIFASAVGKPSMEAIASAFARIVEQTAVYERGGRNGLKKLKLLTPPIDITLYSFRHTFATRCARQGMPPKTLQYLMGHSDIQTTLNFYVDIQDEDLEHARGVISKSFEPNRSAFATEFATVIDFAEYKGKRETPKIQ